MPVPPAPQPSPVHLFIEGTRHDVLEYSPSGVSLPRTALDAPGLRELRRGEPCPGTLQIFGEMYGVVLRLAARGPHHTEFAFVSLPPQAQRALEHYASASAADSFAPSPSADVELPGPIALAFARLADAARPERRLVLPESESVYAATMARRRAFLLPTASAVPSHTVSLVAPRPATALTLTGRDLLLYASGLLTLLSLLLWVLV